MAVRILNAAQVWLILARTAVVAVLLRGQPTTRNFVVVVELEVHVKRGVLKLRTVDLIQVQNDFLNFEIPIVDKEPSTIAPNRPTALDVQVGKEDVRRTDGNTSFLKLGDTSDVVRHHVRVLVEVLCAGVPVVTT